jgi:hypothetical protein
MSIWPRDFIHGYQFTDWAQNIIERISQLLGILQLDLNLFLLFEDVEDYSHGMNLNGLIIRIPCNQCSDATIVEVKGRISYYITWNILWLFNQGRVTHPIESGLCDYVRLKLGLAPPHWDSTTRDRWEFGYSVTAYFFEYIEKRRNGFVRDFVNEFQKDRREHRLIEALTGKDISMWWFEYCSYTVDCFDADNNIKVRVVDQTSSTFFAMFPEPATRLYYILRDTLAELYPNASYPSLKHLTLFIRDFAGVAEIFHQ